MITMTYKSRLKQREQIAEGTMAFYFEKPSGFVFKAGQYAKLTLIDPPESDAEGNVRSFSLASSPLDGHLLFATRMRDTAFKRVLRNKQLDTEVQVDGPMGSFTLHNDEARPAVFLTGGIGITPFFSMIRFATAEKLRQKLYLFYSNGRPEDAAFMKDLEVLETQNPNFRFVPTMTQMDKSHETWKGETGSITRELLVKHLPHLDGPIYYAAGPPAMVKSMREMLRAAGVDQHNIRSEGFAGY
jgi:ferredoxin-NADP reductase